MSAADRKNSFAALENAEEIIEANASDEKQKNENKKKLEGDKVHLKQPLIWIDLEMTGKYASYTLQELQF
jgi:hypothetical protein